MGNLKGRNILDGAQRAQERPVDAPPPAANFRQMSDCVCSRMASIGLILGKV